MTRTNETNLPEFMELLAEDYYPKHGWHTFSVTELQKGSKEIVLTRRHGKEFTEDISDLGAIIVGNAVHHAIERLLETRQTEHEYLVEQRMEIPLDVKADRPVYLSGAFDVLDLTTGHIYDTKTASAVAYAFKAQDDFSEWKHQLRTYWWMREMLGFKVNSASNLLINVGFSKTKMRQDSNYPRRSIIEIPHKFNPIITLEESAELMGTYSEKASTVLEFSELEDDAIPPCSPEERWQRDEHWAIMKKGRKRAISRHFSQEEAELVLEGKERDCYIEYREGVPVKCLDYCNANKHCSFYQEYMAKREETGGYHG